jgi:hypothetical protein
MDETAMKQTGENDLLDVLQTAHALKKEFIKCHSYLDDHLPLLVKLLQDGESRGLLMEETLELLDIRFWLGLIDSQSRYLAILFNFVDNPNERSLRKLIDIHGLNRARARAEVKLLSDQLRRRLARHQQMTEQDVFNLIRDNRDRVLAGHLHLRSGYRGADISSMFGIPRSTAYGWIDWFKALPEKLREGALRFCDEQVAAFVAGQSPGTPHHVDDQSQEGEA